MVRSRPPHQVDRRRTHRPGGAVPRLPVPPSPVRRRRVGVEMGRRDPLAHPPTPPRRDPHTPTSRTTHPRRLTPARPEADDSAGPYETPDLLHSAPVSDPVHP